MCSDAQNHNCDSVQLEAASDRQGMHLQLSGAHMLVCFYNPVSSAPSDRQQAGGHTLRQLSHEHDNAVEAQRQRRARVQRLRPLLQAAQR